MIIFQCSQAKALEAIQIAASVADTNQHSILQHAKLVKTGQLLCITGACPEMEISSTGNLGGEACNFTTTLPVRRVVSILQSMSPNEMVSLESSGDLLILKGRTTQVTLNTWPAENFPSMKFGTETTAVLVMHQRVLAGLIEQVAFAMPAANHHPNLNGVCLRICGDTLTLMASDRITLAMALGPAQATQYEAEVILPRRTVAELQRWMNRGNDVLTVHLTASQARFSVGGLEIITKLLEGRFPDFTKVTSKRPLTAVEVPRAALLSSLQRALILSRDGFSGIHLTLANRTLKVNSVRNEIGASIDEIAVDYVGDTIQASFNAKYLADAVSNTKTDTLTLALGSNKDFLHMTKPGDSSFLYVAAQLRI